MSDYEPPLEVKMEWMTEGFAFVAYAVVVGLAAQWAHHYVPDGVWAIAASAAISLRLVDGAMAARASFKIIERIEAEQRRRGVK